MITELWNQEVPGRIQNIALSNNYLGKKQEIAFSSWNGKIYKIRGESGKQIWQTDSFSYPPATLDFVEIYGKKYLLTSLANSLALLESKKGEKIKEKSLDRVILRTHVADLNRNGNIDILAWTKGGILYLLNEKFKVLWKKELSLSLSPASLYSCDVNYDGYLEPLLISDRLRIFSFRGNEIFTDSSLADHNPLSLTAGYFTKNGTKEVIVGSKGELSLFRNFEKISSKSVPLYPYLLSKGDVNGDNMEEVIVGDWKSDSIKIFTIKNDKIHNHSSFSLKGNPTSMAVGDIERDGKKEILITSESNSFKIIRENELIEERVAFPGEGNIKIGNMIGRGSNDILIQSGREKLSLLTHVPRISAPVWIKQGENFSIYTLVESGEGLEPIDEIISFLEEQYLDRKKVEAGYVSWYKYNCKAKNPGSGKLKLEDNFSYPIHVADNRKIGKQQHIWFTDEDFVQLEEKSIISQLRSLPGIRFREGASTGLYVSSISCGDFPVDSMSFHIRKGGEIFSNIPDLILNRTDISIKFLNLSGRTLRASFNGPPNLEIEKKELSIPPEATKQFSLGLNVKMGEEIKKKIRENIQVRYIGLDTHSLFLPINSVVINENWVREYIDRMKEKIGIDEVLTKISMRLHISKDMLKELFSKNSLI